MRPTLLRATVYLYQPEAPEHMLRAVIELLAMDETDFRRQLRLRYPNPNVCVECAVVAEPWRLQGLPRASREHVV